MASAKDVVIISAVRTPVGRYMGALRTVEAYDLAALVLSEVVGRIGLDPAAVDEVIMGQAYQNGEYVNIARMALLTAGWPDATPGLTIDRRCCTGLEVVRLASALISSGQAEVIAVGGVESMSNSEFYLPGRIKWGVGGEKGMPRGHGDLSIWGLPFYDRIQRARVMSQPHDRYGVLPSMMSWAETAAEVESISREACDEWAYHSHRKACEAWNDGRFAEEVVPVSVPQVKGDPVLVEKDENPRPDVSLEKLAKLRPVLGGVCTAGNSSSENDGAAALIMTTLEKAEKLGMQPLAAVRSTVAAGDDPRHTYRAVPTAVNKALEKAGQTLDNMGLIEIQEAFAAQVLADLKGLNLGPNQYDRINVNGSGISLGHPIACTGVRLLVTLVNEMRRRKVDYGLAGICGGGGLGIAGVLERV